MQLEGLINDVLPLFRNVVGQSTNSVIASMPACFVHEGHGTSVSEYGYPAAFTSDEVDYCNLMYWIILPSLGARVYCVASSATHVARDQLRYREGDRDLTRELGLENDRGLTVARLNGRCVFSKVQPAACATDVTECFEPTASLHANCTNQGFHETSVVTYMWAIRIRKISAIGNNLAKVLLGMHYSTLLTHDVVRDHYNTTYYSGMSYLLFRGVRFTGCGVSLMQQKSALYTLGTEVLCNPTSNNTHQVYTMNQYCELVVIPDTLVAPGVYIPGGTKSAAQVPDRGEDVAAEDAEREDSGLKGIEGRIKAMGRLMLKQADKMQALKDALKAVKVQNNMLTKIRRSPEDPDMLFTIRGAKDFTERTGVSNKLCAGAANITDKKLEDLRRFISSRRGPRT